MITYAITNQKGGCGKTTTAVNLAAVLALRGRRTLLVDLDPQAHATLGLGLTPERLEHTVQDLFADPGVPFGRILRPTPVPNLVLAPSNVLLSGAESILLRSVQREQILLRRLSAVADEFDCCLIDCSPSLSLLTINALVACDEIIVPVQTHYYAIEGLRQVLETVDVIRERFHPALALRGILLTFADRRALLCRQVEQQLREYFGDRVLRTVIRHSLRLAEAPSAGLPIVQYAPQSSGALEYQQLAEELCHELQVRTSQENLVHI